MEQEKSPQQKAAATIRERHGADFYSRIAKLGNTPDKPRPSSFRNNPSLASKAGKASAAARKLKKEQESK